ncbi:amidohydrolase [Actinoplanes ianthinogenes]|uniref:Amidohydrolase n=1 Tax=Actinoplanes ianthinogenes TaxID=122358 RepID=A0ABM7M9N5_9ACTN|nr:amidohydrolase family protein [Actinoplanes ianthinogenes]BCJ48385.1 amidohydrolase [Actinoplanes ianthinogenes]GGR46743.1 amidohydrolase [Actinoplanes ianthinogenes]
MEIFTIAHARIFDGREVVPATHLRVENGLVAAIGDASIARPGDVLVDGSGGTVLPGLIDAHVHLLPGCTRLAPLFGVTTLIDQFSKPDVIEKERAAGPVRADFRTSGVGATAPGGHPTIAYAPIPYLTGPDAASPFVEARLAEGATHVKMIYDDGSGAMLDIPSLDPATIDALVTAAHRHGLPVVAHVSTAAGAVHVTRHGVDVLAHVPFDRMRDAEVREVARSGVAVIATLDIVDGFPGPDGLLPLLADPGLADRLTPRWRRVLRAQSRRWMPPFVPDGAAARENVLALLESGVRILAGTDAPNPGLVHGASLHRELAHLVHAGLRPAEALAAATSLPAEVFGLADRGCLRPGARADLVLVDGDPTTVIEQSRSVRHTWIGGRPVVPGRYPGSPAERNGIAWLRASTDAITAAIRERWPQIPAPEQVVREDGEIVGRLVPTAGGWQAETVFGAPLGDPQSKDDARRLLLTIGLSVLAEPWWIRTPDGGPWREASLVEVRSDRIRLRWTDHTVASYDPRDLDFTTRPPAVIQDHRAYAALPPESSAAPAG